MPLGWPTVVLSSEQLVVSSGVRVFHGKLSGELTITQNLGNPYTTTIVNYTVN